MKFVRLFTVVAAACAVTATPLGAVDVHVRNTGTLKCNIRPLTTLEGSRMAARITRLDAGEEQKLGLFGIANDFPKYFAGIEVYCGTNTAYNEVVSLHYDIACTPEGVTIAPGEPYSAAEAGEEVE